MKYTISINQKAVADNHLNLDIIDLAIFDYIKDFALSKYCQKINDNGKTFFWIKASKIIEDMPILGINSERGINSRISKLVDAGILIRHSSNKSMRRSFFAVGENYEKLIFSTWNEKSQHGTTVPSNMERKFQVTWNENSKDYNTIYNNTIYNNNSITSCDVVSDEKEIVDNFSFQIKTKKEKEKSCEKKEKDLNADFDDFWNVYDKKRGDRDKLLKKWVKLSQKDKDAIMLYLPKYKEAQPDKKYRKDPMTFFNQRAWNDEIIYSNAPATEKNDFKNVDVAGVSDTRYDTF